MATIVIGSVTLDETYAPFANMSYEYFTTPNGEIIGGSRIFTVTGTVSVSQAAKSGATVMSKLAQIRNLGQDSGCVSVSIPNLYSGMGKITNVSIDQGPDPSWVNQGSFTIEIKAKLKSIPPNSMGITVDDHAVSISKSETIEIGEESHGFVFLNDQNNISKSYVKFSCKATASCRPLCDPLSPQEIALRLIKKFVAYIPNHPLISAYKNWKPFAQSRSLDVTSTETSFSIDIILLPPSVTTGAFIDLEFEHNKTYQEKEESKRISGSIIGLASISWTDLIDLPNTTSGSKLASAEEAFNKIISKYNYLKEFDSNGKTLILNEKPNCPPAGGGVGGSSIGNCKGLEDTKEDPQQTLVIQPSTSSVSKSRSDGTINFVFEWSSSSSSNNNDCVDGDGYKRELVVDITEPQRQIVEHIIPSYGTLIQDINACSAKRISFTSSASSSDVCVATNARPTGVIEPLDKAVKDYLGSANPRDWLLISHTSLVSNKNYTITKEFIKKC